MYDEYDSVRFFAFFFPSVFFGFLADFLAGVFLAGGICVEFLWKAKPSSAFSEWSTLIGAGDAHPRYARPTYAPFCLESRQFLRRAPRTAAP